MDSGNGLRGHVRHKLARGRRAGQRSVQFPKELTKGDDAQDDVTACKDRNGQQMNQSLFSMIAAAGSKANFNARFDDESSGDDEGSNRETESETAGREQQGDVTSFSQGARLRDTEAQRKSQHRKMMASLPSLRLRSKKSRQSETDDDRMSSSQILPARSGIETDRDTEAPLHARKNSVLGRMLKAQAEFQDPTLALEEQKGDEGLIPGTSGAESSGTLTERLKEIFDFEQPEDIISEYPCWLLKSVLLQGYMYITQKHVCFYAYLPKKSDVVMKSGHLAKQGRRNPKYSRYWFILRGDVLSYYSDPSNLYFPSGNIDLRYCISADHADSKKPKDETAFSLTTDQRTYHFKADSTTSAKEWVKTLRKFIFRSHNEGDSVKISLPTDNIIDIEESQVMDFADTVKIRVIDNDETYAIDEYFFSFFSLGKEAVNDLKATIGENGPAAQHKDSSDTDCQSPDRAVFKRPRHPQEEGHAASPKSAGPSYERVKATLTPIVRSREPSPSGARADSVFVDPGGYQKRWSVDLRRDVGGRVRSASTGHAGLHKDRDMHPQIGKHRPQGSTDSYTTLTDQGTASAAAVQSMDDSGASGSQLLSGDDLFRSPTMAQSVRRASPDLVQRVRSRSADTIGDKGSAGIRVQPATRQTTAELTNDKLGAQGSLETDDELKVRHSSSSTALQELVRAGAYPLHKASGLADYFKNHSRRMSSLLASESMGYYEKVSGYWAGGKKHYTDAEGLAPDDQVREVDDGESPTNHGDRFRAHFALPDSERLQATYFGYLHRLLPLYGKIYISSTKFCFRSLLPGTRTKMILPLRDVENIHKEKGFRLGWLGLVVVVRGHEELFFEFGTAEVRDDCAVTLLQTLDHIKYFGTSGAVSREEQAEAEFAEAEHAILLAARQHGHTEQGIGFSSTAKEIYPAALPILFDDSRASIINFKPKEPLRITCLTIGSRGDVQPYISLCKGLLAEGHRPRIATHAEFGPWVKSHGIDFRPVEGDPAELMRICVEHGMFTYSFMREATSKFRGWLDELLRSAWKACQETDVLIESPSAMGGIHIAEALAIPYFRAFGMPWTRTRAYPHAFAVPEHRMGGAYNYISYVMFDNVFWKAISAQINRWRKRDLGLPSTSLDRLQPNKVPFLYNFSPTVVVPPLDYPDWIRVTGYWFLDEGKDYKPDKELTEFIANARKDGKKLLYVGFGSIVVDDPTALTKSVVDSVVKADVRCILSKGWSDRLGKKNASIPEVPLPPSIFQIKAAPHDWLFPQLDAAAHHGGAGTTGASLRAGLPTIIKPFFGDQYFFGARIEDLGVGICLKKLNTSVLARAFWEATHSERMIVKAKVLGQQIRQEDGVGNAIQALYRDLEYAKTLIKRKSHGAGEGTVDDGEGGDFDESWTFIGDDGDPELALQSGRRFEDLALGSMIRRRSKKSKSMAV